MGQQNNKKQRFFAGCTGIGNGPKLRMDANDAEIRAFVAQFNDELTDDSEAVRRSNAKTLSRRIVRENIADVIGYADTMERLGRMNFFKAAIEQATRIRNGKPLLELSQP